MLRGDSLQVDHQDLFRFPERRLDRLTSRL
jgi:hypothetical protein